MILQQTIISPVDPNRVFEVPTEENPEETEFVQTPFDTKVAEFIDAISEEGYTVMQKTYLPLHEHIAVVIDYVDNETLQKTMQHSNIITPVKNPSLQV